jgi:pre-60S factor REI1
MQNQAQFTSTTAPGTIFSSREELGQHYKSEWHKYNLKRREANLPMLTQSDFQARLDAAMALRREKEGKDKKSGTDHLKKQHSQQDKPLTKLAGSGAPDTLSTVSKEDEEVEEEEEEGNIDPTVSLFDRHVSMTVKDNVQYMYQTFGFFLPDQEYLVDLEGLIGYCHEKIQLGHVCLYCQKIFGTAQSCKQHMIQTRHTMLRYQGKRKRKK